MPPVETPPCGGCCGFCWGACGTTPAGCESSKSNRRSRRISLFCGERLATPGEELAADGQPFATEEAYSAASPFAFAALTRAPLAANATGDAAEYACSHAI